MKDIERLTHSYACKAADNADCLHSVAIALTWFLWRELIPFGHRGLSVGTAPSHLRELITSYHPARSFFVAFLTASQDSAFLVWMKTPAKTKTRSGALNVVPKLWNNLPDGIQKVENIEGFRRLLKTHLFSES